MLLFPRHVLVGGIAWRGWVLKGSDELRQTTAPDEPYKGRLARLALSSSVNSAKGWRYCLAWLARLLIIGHQFNPLSGAPLGLS